MNQGKWFEIIALSRACDFNELIVVLLDDILCEIKHKGLCNGRYDLELMSLIVHKLSLGLDII